MKLLRHETPEIGGQANTILLDPLLEWALQDFRSSGISEEYALLCFEKLEGDAAVQILAENAIAEAQSVGYVTKKAQRILDKYQFAAKGGWVARSATLEGMDMPSAYFKPISPRRENGGFGAKFIKYETAAASIADPLLPPVPWAMGLRIAKKYDLEEEYVERILQAHERYESEAERRAQQAKGFGSSAKTSSTGNPDESSLYSRAKRMASSSFGSRIDKDFWNWATSVSFPIRITEGWKKACKLTETGHPTIALRGISCWHLKGNKQALHPRLEAFATKGREITIVFDQDTKPETIRNVNRQINDLGAELQSRGCIVRVAEWGASEGKGIDDAIVAQGENGAAWLEAVMKSAPTLDEFKKDALIRKLKRVIAKLNSLSVTPDRATEGDYMPKLPKDSLTRKIIVLGANTGAGKSVRIGEDLIREWIAQGGNVIVLGNLNSLGFQNAKRFNIPHIGHYNLADQDQREAFYADISARHGVALCFDSLLKIPDWFYDRPLLIVLDEVNQGLEHLLFGGTLGDKQPEILERFSEIAAKAVQIAAAESAVYDRSLTFVKSVSKIEEVQYFKHWRNSAPWDVRIGSGNLSGFLPSLGDSLGANGKPIRKILYVTSSQKNARIVERIYRLRYPNKRIERIDSETNREGAFDSFFDDPTAYLQEADLDILILSPSAKTGVSIEWEGFDAVVGCFQCLDVSAWEQLLGRYRPAVPRYVLVDEFISANGDEGLTNPIAIARRQQRNAEGFAKLYEIEALSETDDWRYQIKLAAMQFCYETAAVKGCQKAIAREALCDRLKAVGHNVVETRWEADEIVAEELKAAKFSIWREDAKKYAIAEPLLNEDGSPGAEKARQILGNECSLEDEIRAEKTLLMEEFPGIDFSDEQNCYWMIAQQWGDMTRGVRNQIKAEFINVTRERDRIKAEKILSDPLGLHHRLPRSYMQALLRQKLGVLDLALDVDAEFSNQSPKVLEVQKRSLQYKAEIRYWLGLTIDKEYKDSKGRKRHTPMDIASKLLGQLGLELRQTRKPGKKGDRTQLYKIQCALKIQNKDSETQERQEAWEARSQMLRAARTRYQQLEANLSPPEPKPAPAHDEEAVVDCLQIIRDCLRAGAEQAAAGIWAELNEYDRREAWRRLSPQEKAILQNHRRAAA